MRWRRLQSNPEPVAQWSPTSADDKREAAAAKAKRIVVKIGSALLTDAESGALRAEWLRALIDDVAELRNNGAQVVLVSSGAIALGRGILGLRGKALRLEESQAAAAAGQVHLAHAYQAALAAKNLPCAQILLTLEDTEQRRRYLNARNTFNTLLKLGAVPVVNENDTVATSEIRYGDNDRLAARVAQMISADCMVLLSDIDGLYTADPGLDPAAQHFAEVASITPEIEAMAGGSGSTVGTGGMITKLAAAKIATGAGCAMAIANGRILHPLRALAGRRALHLVSGAWLACRRAQTMDCRRAGTRGTPGSGCRRGRRRCWPGKSLLPAGVREITGEFSRGDAVIVLAPDGAGNRPWPVRLYGQRRAPDCRA